MLAFLVLLFSQVPDKRLRCEEGGKRKQDTEKHGGDRQGRQDRGAMEHGEIYGAFFLLFRPLPDRR